MANEWKVLEDEIDATRTPNVPADACSSYGGGGAVGSTGSIFMGMGIGMGMGVGWPEKDAER